MSNELDLINSFYVNSITTILIRQQPAACAGSAKMQRSCSSEVGIAIGVIIAAECMVVMVITISVVLCLWR